MSDLNTLLTQIYQAQLGRDPDAEGLSYWMGRANDGMSLADITQSINTSLEGQNFDTEALTAGYRSAFGRNPEQEGFQYWLSDLQSRPTFTAEMVKQALVNGASAADLAAYQANPTGFTSPTVAALEADPYAGRYSTNSIYNVVPDAVNVSSINGQNVQFVTPVGQTPVISNFQSGKDGSLPTFTAKVGDYTLNQDQALAQIGTALASGALSRADYDTMLNSLAQAKSVQDIQNAFNASTAAVNLGSDGFQTGVNGQPVDFASILANTYKGVNTATTKRDVVNKSNVTPTLTNLLKMVQSSYGTPNSISTPLSGNFYSERGLETQFAPLGQGPMFRSGVAGYTDQLPNVMAFGTSPIVGNYPVYTPGSWADFQAQKAAEEAQRIANEPPNTGDA